jgi:adenylate kinase
MRKQILVGCLLLLLGIFHENGFSAIAKDQKKPFVLLILGPPGSGRATLAVKLSNTFLLPHISCAKLLLDHINEETEIGQKARDFLNAGTSVPDDIIFNLLHERIKKEDCKDGFVLDGFPKTVEQAKILQKYIGQGGQFMATYINVSEDWLLLRAEGRMVCQSCGRVYHKQLSPPQKPDLCDLCQSDLCQREADTREHVQDKLDVYKTEILPVLTYYKQEKLLMEIDGNRPLEKMYVEMKEVISNLVSSKS